MSDREDDSDAPEEFTVDQGFLKNEEIAKVQKENEARVAREGKERRRQWAEKKTPRPSRANETKVKENAQDVTDKEAFPAFEGSEGMLPNDIVEVLAAREKQAFASDSEEEYVEEKPISKKKRRKAFSGQETVILNELPPAQCLKNSLDFLKKRKMQVSRSHAVLNNSTQALRLLCTSSLLSKK